MHDVWVFITISLQLKKIKGIVTFPSLPNSSSFVLQKRNMLLWKLPVIKDNILSHRFNHSSQNDCLFKSSLGTNVVQ